MSQIRNCLANGLVAGALASAALLSVSAAEAATETVVYSFQNKGTDGTQPQAGLINVKGTLYGTAFAGGTYGEGTVYSVNSTTGAETVVYTFKGGTDGASPTSGLIRLKGMLYGTTPEGGGNCANQAGCGTVFSVNIKTGAETVVHAFQNNGTDGAYPTSALINVKGTLYSTTIQGGTYGYGTVFSLNPATGTETVVHSFQNNGTDGLNPSSALINVNGTLYGTTNSGGTYGSYGTVFSVNIATGAETVVHSFRNNGTDGFFPLSPLINVNGILYGTTDAGGAYGAGGAGGTVFSVNIAAGAETVVHSFQYNGTDGAVPFAGLIRVKGTLYGTTTEGGAYGCGTVFSVNAKTGAETVVYSFQNNGTDGAVPLFGNLLDVKGALYGTTELGGAYGAGTVFEITQP